VEDMNTFSSIFGVAGMSDTRHTPTAQTVVSGTLRAFVINQSPKLMHRPRGGDEDRRQIAAGKRLPRKASITARGVQPGRERSACAQWSTRPTTHAIGQGGFER
jgi:hypothetical protein